MLYLPKTLVSALVSPLGVSVRRPSSCLAVEPEDAFPPPEEPVTLASSSSLFFLKRVSVIGRKKVQSKPYCLQCWQTGGSLSGKTSHLILTAIIRRLYKASSWGRLTLFFWTDKSHKPVEFWCVSLALDGRGHLLPLSGLPTFFCALWPLSTRGVYQPAGMSGKVGWYP